MITKFRILFTVHITHTYYGGTCRDFDFTIPPDTAKLLRGGKLLPKVRDGKLHILFETDDKDIALVPIDGKTVRIGLKLLNPYFSNFTVLDPHGNGSALLYRNTTVISALDSPTRTALVGQRFSHSISKATRPVTVTLKNSNDQVLQTETVTAGINRKTVSCDLTTQGSGAYTVEEVYPADTSKTLYYFEPEMQQAGIFGIIEIKIDNTFYTAPPAFEISFNAREDVLKYYIVAKKYTDTEFAQLQVRDSGFTTDGREQVSFTRIELSEFTDDELSPSLLGAGDARVVLFKSEEPVARMEKARKKIQLVKNGEVLIAHLPQAGADKTGGDFIIHISKS